MRRGWRVIGCGIVGLALGACAGEPATITKYDTRRMPPDIVISRVLDQVADLLGSAAPTAPDGMRDADKQRAIADIASVIASRRGTDLDASPPQQQPVRALLDALAPLVTIWPDPYITPHPHTPLHEIEFQTRPHATATPGLCAMDFVAVHFAYTGADRGPATRARASGVEVDRYYDFITLPDAAVLPKTDAAAWAQTDRACAVLDWEKDDFFLASGEAVEVKIGWLARTVIARAAAGDPRFAILCDEERRKGATDCARALHGVQPKLLHPRDCPDTDAPCSFFFLGDGIPFAVTMDTATPPKIVQISRDWDVVTGHPPAD